MSIRSRLALAACAVVVPLTTAVGLLIVTDEWRRAAGAVEAGAADLAASIDEELADSGQTRIGRLAAGERALLLGADGLELDGTTGFGDTLERVGLFDGLDVGSLGPDEVFAGEYDDADGTTWHYAAVRCTESSACDAVVVARLPTTWVSTLRSHLPWLAAGVVGSTLLTYLGVRWLVGRSLRPVEAMRAELESITSTDLTRRVPVPASGDELEALGTSLNATVDRIEKAVTAHERFASDAAHELRSPLTGLRASLELASLHPDRAAHALPNAIGQIDRASALIDDLLELARRDGGAAVRPFGPVDLDDLVRTEVREAERRHPDRRFERGPIEPLQIRGDAGDLARAVRNLLDNAARYGASVVRASCTVAVDRAVVTVEDDGPGVPPGQRAQIFERFARLDTSRSRVSGGTGLGLAIVADIATAHRATVSVDTSPSLGGASFAVSLPFA